MEKNILITLTIFDETNKPYWTEYFDSLENKNKWLDEEKTRPYWKKGFTHTENVKEDDVILPDMDSITALSYLRETDYLIIRELEKSLKDLDPEIKRLRNEARVKAKK